MEFKINMMAVGIAVIANFILGFLWYTPIFGKAWAKEMGFSPDMQVPKSEMIKGLLFMVIGNFLFAWVYAHNMEAWTFVPDMDKMSPAMTAFNSALFTWLGFYLPGQLGDTVWSKHSWKLFAINTSYSFASLLLASFILSFMP